MLRPVPDGIVQLPEPVEGGVFDYGFVQVHWLSNFERHFRLGNVLVCRVIHVRLVIVSKMLEN